MRLPVVRGLIERRILLTYRVDPAVAAALLPSPFVLQAVNGYAVAGICLIRLGQVRARGCPSWFGLSSENAAHRFAVTWQERGETIDGVYIPRRDTSSRLNALVGGRIFPGFHHHARFQVRESSHRWQVALMSDDAAVDVAVDACPTAAWRSELFDTLENASAFYRRGARGYSPTLHTNHYDGLELRCDEWQVTPLAVSDVRSNYFDDRRLFPSGSIAFDSALLMRNIPHRWIGLTTLSDACGGGASSALHEYADVATRSC